MELRHAEEMKEFRESRAKRRAELDAGLDEQMAKLLACYEEVSHQHVVFDCGSTHATQGVAGALDTEMSAVLREGLADAELRARLMSLTKAAEANGGTEG